jgi:prephenate dehydratase
MLVIDVMLGTLLRTLCDVVEAVLHGGASVGVVPADNSTFGSVVASLPGSASIAGDHVLPINEVLIVRRGL